MWCVLLALLAAAACPASQPAGGGDADQPEETGAPDADRREDTAIPVEADLDMRQEEVDAPPLPCGYPASGYQLVEGGVLAPFPLRDCQGEPTSLPELWCGNRVTIVHVSTGWCVFCEEAFQRLIDLVVVPLEGEPLGVMELFVEAGHDEPATPEHCRQWASRFDPQMPTYVPPEGALSGPLAELAHASTPPLTVLIDDYGEIRMWTRVGAPEFIDIDMEELRRRVERILREP